MRVCFYGRLADLFGSRNLDDAPDNLTDGTALRDWLIQNHQQLSEGLTHLGTRLVLDNEVTDWDAPLSGAHDIAIIPIVSGG
ncbi:MoaD/ThiS family protein [Alphaproteobacteria bacterium]|nr:MoaD/ThiS family protein [Alphaproteobacteria bacterium]